MTELSAAIMQKVWSLSMAIEQEVYRQIRGFYDDLGAPFGKDDDDFRRWIKEQGRNYRIQEMTQERRQGLRALVDELIAQKIHKVEWNPSPSGEESQS